MLKEEIKEHKRWKHMHSGSGAVYGLGFIGALIYFLQHSPTFGDSLIGIFKAVVWPAFLIHKVFTVLGM